MINSERLVCEGCGYPIEIGEHAPDCPKKNEQKTELKNQNLVSRNLEILPPPENEVVIPVVENLVYTDSGHLLSDSDFEELEGDQREELPHALFRPITFSEPRRGQARESTLVVKSTIAMGKAGFVEYPVSFRGEIFYFVQWKGVGRNRINVQIEETALRNGATVRYPFGKEGFAPLMHLSAETPKEHEGEKKTQKIKLTRFSGAAFYEDLLLEKKGNDRVAALGIRSPRIISTIKFSRSFCRDNNLPLPENDDPNDVSGQTLSDYIKNQSRTIDAETAENLLSTADSHEYKSAILGQNIRVFRNVFRVSELEMVMKDDGSPGETENKLKTILEASKKVLSKEFGEEFSDQKFAEKFAFLLGEQAAALLNNSILQGAMLNHKQDITLAAEICDWDGMEELTEEYYRNPPDWVVAGGENSKKSWRKEKSIKIHRQIFLVGAHIKPIIDAQRKLGVNIDEEQVLSDFVDGIISRMSAEQSRRLFEILRQENQLGNIEDIAAIKNWDGDKETKTIDEQIAKNFAGYQYFFDRIRDKILDAETRITAIQTTK